MGRALLFLVGGMFIIFGLVQRGVSDRQSVIPERTMHYQEELHAANTVNSVMEYAIREVINDQSWDEDFTLNDFMNADVNIQVYSNGDSDIPPNNIESWNQYTLMIHGTSVYEDQQAVSEVHLRKDSFSKYSYFTNNEPNNIYFIWSDVLSGPVHTNGRFNMAGDPTFFGEVTSPEMWNGYGGMENNPNFFGGHNFNSPTKNPPSSYALQALRNSASSGGLQFNNEVQLEFLSNGQLRVREKTGWNWNSASNYTVNLNNYNGVISSSENIYMKGVINGQYTVHSEETITIMGDIQYSDDPIDNPESTDLLGIVSEEEVIIDDNAHRDSGNRDLTIHASIMALDKSFSAEHYNYGGSRGDLNLLGGIIQEERGPMGTFSNNTIQSGFNKQYVYDERLLNMVPPDYPRESFFSLIHWITNVTPAEDQQIH